MRLGIIASGICLLSLLPARALAADPPSVRSGPLIATVRSEPWRLELLDSADGTTLTQLAGTGSGPVGALGFHTLAGWSRATRVTESRQRADGGLDLVLATTDAARSLRVELRPAGEGSITLEATVADEAEGVDAVGISFQAPAGERFFGFGSRSNALDHRGGEVENYVADGPYREEDRNYVRASVPPWATRDRDDATYYPVPWMLSSRGYGVMVQDDETSSFRLALDQPDAWSVQTSATRMRLRFFAGPAPADALRRYTAAVGRQPPPSAPWIFGPWFQTGQPNVIPLAEEAQITKTLRDADVPVSAAETQMHYLPCGAQRGNEEYLRERNAFFHAQGLAHLAYFNPSLCLSYSPVFAQASAAGVLQRGPLGEAFSYPAFVGGSGPAGFTEEPLAQFDFSAPGAESFYEGLVREAVAAGHDGWMEDFGENTPPFARSADGTPGSQMHNRYPRDYHCTGMRIARRQPRAIVRFQRSGWTGAAACADAVWGGDPTTVWGYDGLASTIPQALGMGMSGVSRWGSDIGGYNSFGPQERLTPELLKRWIQMGAVSAVMRTKRSGIAVPSYTRPQVFDPEVLPVWKRYTKLHTQLYPYLPGRRRPVPAYRNAADESAGPDPSRRSTRGGPG